MPFSHHSHSGQFCNHAVSSLAAIVAAASARGFHTYALTEHCPRGDAHLYPGEREAGDTPARQREVYDAFVREAARLREVYVAGGPSVDEDGAGPATAVPGAREKFEVEELPSDLRGRRRDPGLPPLKILVGFEAEWIEPVESTVIVRSLLAAHARDVDYFVGSVHFVRGLPIDYDRAHYERARAACGGDGASDVDLYAAYYDDQLAMMRALRPRVVGHFDLVRLLSDAPDRAWDEASPAMRPVWARVVRNLEHAAGAGALLEVNTSALRKGLAQPYPRAEICARWRALGGDVVLSDDAHAVAHVGTNYEKVLPFLKSWGCERIAYLEPNPDPGGEVLVRTMPLSELESMAFWQHGQT